LLLPALLHLLPQLLFLLLQLLLQALDLLVVLQVPRLNLRLQAL
jgi:hypothetical protein